MTDVFPLLTIAGVLFLGVLSPGPNFAMVTSTAMTVSRRAAILTGLGLAAASGTWALLAVAGLGVIVAKVPWIYAAVKGVGAAYLIVIGGKMLLGAGKPMGPAKRGSAYGPAVVRKAFPVSMTNPKAAAFYGSILTVMVPASAPAWFLVAIVVIAALVSAAWYGGLALLFSHGAARRIFAKARAGIETTMGLILIGLGGKMLLSR